MLAVFTEAKTSTLSSTFQAQLLLLLVSSGTALPIPGDDFGAIWVGAERGEGAGDGAF